MVVMLHDCTQHPADFAACTGMNETACEQGFYALYPAQPQKMNPQRCWNWFNRSHHVRSCGEAALLAGMTRAVIEEHGLASQGVYVARLAADGAIAAILGTIYPDVFAVVGVHSGLPVGAAKDLASARHRRLSSSTVTKPLSSTPSTVSRPWRPMPALPPLLPSWNKAKALAVTSTRRSGSGAMPAPRSVGGRVFGGYRARRGSSPAAVSQ
jgi:poly(hydroxyalkanoate) depolymerase family esterase